LRWLADNLADKGKIYHKYCPECGQRLWIRYIIDEFANIGSLADGQNPKKQKR
jgi:hypothetical protein